MSLKTRVGLGTAAALMVVAAVGLPQLKGNVRDEPASQASVAASPSAFAKRPTTTWGPKDLVIEVNWYQDEVRSRQEGALTIEYWYHGGPNLALPSSFKTFPELLKNESRSKDVWLYWLTRDYDGTPVAVRASASNRSALLTCAIYAPQLPEPVRNTKLGTVECSTE